MAFWNRRNKSPRLDQLEKPSRRLIASEAAPERKSLAKSPTGTVKPSTFNGHNGVNPPPPRKPQPRAPYKSPPLRRPDDFDYWQNAAAVAALIDSQEKVDSRVEERSIPDTSTPDPTPSYTPSYDSSPSYTPSYSGSDYGSSSSSSYSDSSSSSSSSSSSDSGGSSGGCGGG